MADQLRNANTKRLIRIGEVSNKTGWGRAMIYRAIREKRFPANIRLGERSVAWDETEVDSWISERISASRKVAA